MKPISSDIQSTGLTDKTTVQRQPQSIFFVVFTTWVLSLPFHQFSVIASYSVDNLLAPMLCLMSVFQTGIRDRNVAARRFKVILIMMGLYAIYGIGRLMPTLQNPGFTLEIGWKILRSGFYFMAPALFIRDLWSFRITKSLLAVVTVTGAVSAFLASIGLVHLEVERFADSRLGADWLPKGIGLFSSYGDMAILCAFTTVLLLSHERTNLRFGLGTYLGKLFVWISLILGIAGSQSRNIVLSTLAAITAFWVYLRIQKSSANLRAVAMLFLLSAGIISVGLAILFGSNLVESVSSTGGEKAYNTAQTRLVSYKQAVSLILKEPIWGVSHGTYRMWEPLIEGLHNMWLKLLLIGGIPAFFSIAGLLWLAFSAGLRPAEGALLDAEPPLILSTAVAIFIATQFYGGLTDRMWVMLSMLISFSWVRCQQR